MLAALPVTLLRRAARLVEVDVPLRRAFDDRRDAARETQVVFEVEPPRRAEARSQEVVQRAPIETRRPHGLSVVAGRQQPRRMSPPARDRQAQLDDHGGLHQRQVLHLDDDDAVELGANPAGSASSRSRATVARGQRPSLACQRSLERGLLRDDPFRGARGSSPRKLAFFARPAIEATGELQ